MAKTAYLYDFSVFTRVVADPDDFKDENDLYDYLTRKARENILSDPENYLFGENGHYEEDTECPFGELNEDLNQ